MPRHPDVAPSVAAIGGSVYSALGHRLATFTGPTFPLHVGDTWLEPPEGCRMEDLTVAEYPGMHRYASPHGMAPLIEALVERIRARTGVPTDPGNLILAAGATGGLGAVAGAILAPGDEVLLLAPYWPLIAGIVRSFHAEPVAVPFFGRVDSPETAVEAVAEVAGEKTVALYFNTPNNPSGKVIPREQVEALVAWAAGRGLWVISDEVYEDYCYAGEHADRPAARARSAPSPPTRSPRPTAWPATAAATWWGRPSRWRRC